ncbi:hypothetical protein [Lysobacter gummosus]
MAVRLITPSTTAVSASRRKHGAPMARSRGRFRAFTTCSTNCRW